MIKQIRIPQHTPQWHQWRFEHGFGGSDIAAVVATKSKTIADLSYTSPVKQFLTFIGEPVDQFSGNIASESGHYFENIILEWLKYYDLEDHDQLAMFRRIKAKERRINKVIQPKVFMVNSKYPHLFYSPDAWVFPNHGKDKWLGECKNTTSMEANRYLAKVSPAFYLQVQQGLMITELPYALLNILIDGRWLNVIRIEPHQPTWDLIIEASTEMWDKIQRARTIKKQYSLPSYFGVNHETLTEEQRKAVEMLTELEPDITGTESELAFIREMIKPSEVDNPMQGTETQRTLCEEYLGLGDEQDLLEIERKKRQVWLIQSLQGSNKAEFEDGTFFSYKSDTRGSRRLYVSPKILTSIK